MRVPSEMSKKQKLFVLTCSGMVCMVLIVGTFQLLQWALAAMQIDVSATFIWILQMLALFLCYGYFAKRILAEAKKKT
jgi:hypothetical protein